MQIDVASGYGVIPGPLPIEFPQMLNFGQPKLLGYTEESIVADKLEAMVSRDESNTRLKDFYDIWILSNVRRFEGEYLEAAINETFKYYGTKIPNTDPICFKPKFYEDNSKQIRWKTFLRDTGIEISEPFGKIVLGVRDFLMPLCMSISEKITMKKFWNSKNGWTSKP